MIATISASQVTIGAQNDNGFRVIGTSGTLEWSITDHTVLKHYAAGQPLQVYRQGAEYGYFPGSVKPYLRFLPATPKVFTRHWQTCTGRWNGRSARDAARQFPNRSAPGDRRRRRGNGLHRGRRRQLKTRRRMGRSTQDQLTREYVPAGARLRQENAP